MVTVAEALAVIDLTAMKDELRIPATDTSHDALLTQQIQAAVSFVSKSSSATTDDERRALRMAAVAVCRDLYDGQREITDDAAAFSWMAPFQSYKAVE